MSGIPNSSITELINHSLAEFKDRGRFEAEFDLQEYPVTDYWFTKDAYKVQSGNKVEWRINPTGNNGSFRFVNKFETTPRNYTESMQKASVDWCYGECKAVYEARTMKEMRGKAELYDYLKNKYFDAVMSAYNGIEASAFSSPLDASDTKRPLGVFWWLNPLDANTTDADGSFSGQSARYADGVTAVTTTIGGLSKSTYPKYKNWAATYSGRVDFTAIETLRRGLKYTDFKAPRNIKEFYSAKTRKLAIYSGFDQQLQYEALVNAGPDDRNGDLSPFKGTLTFRGVEWNGIPQLNGATGSPVCWLNRAHFFPIIHEAWWWTKTEPMNDQDNPHVYTVQWDFQYNFGCDSPRKAGGLMTTVLTY